ncbi:hypothetical protein [Neorhizobium galegae]|uniref:hypothetical protein n=1 Tax=Neorhizobium galegae TaxID=399 RepID=UPI0006223D76|nr:hypothetical protein [Neorhizobium galegae]CDZ27721.1 Hypothetical protein NGAL_HAMBI490_25710 [Neorhizobium galegae bv. officinalis]KAA9386714.1 hypothetical protein F4V88_09635 [Neorhizobium galegae]KAB1109467.1 hypothetical protein F4V89_27405 [Neorhizobium galegae]MCM2501515.1 hypothetical protein [Neorhizobium galegae]MCQ1772465.1 hypothetical protein [Neorhizobium galegae]
MTEILDLSHVRLGDRPLVVCDVDDVVLHFVAPFQEFLRREGHELLPRSFRLTGNIVSIETQIALEHPDVRRLIEDFFEAQENWQIPTDLVVQTLETLSKDADVVFLTAMPPRYRDHRRRLLDQIGLSFPLIASEEPKGPIMQRLHAGRPLPSVFIDDMAHNLHSVRDHVAECLVLHMMPDSPLHLLAPKPAEGIVRATDWSHAAELIRRHIEPKAA